MKQWLNTQLNFHKDMENKTKAAPDWVYQWTKIARIYLP